MESDLTTHAVEVVLEGGPPEIPEGLRRRSFVSADRKIKLPYRGGYEHFELVSEPALGDSAPAIFRWTMRTEIAE